MTYDPRGDMAYVYLVEPESFYRSNRVLEEVSAAATNPDLKFTEHAAERLVRLSPGSVIAESAYIEGGSIRAERARTSMTREELLGNLDYAKELPSDLVLDLDERGRILGIEVFSPGDALPRSVLASAEKPPFHFRSRSLPSPSGSHRVLYDRGSETAYVRLVEPADDGLVHRTVLVEGRGEEATLARAAMSRAQLLEAPALIEELRGNLAFDLDDTGHILGFKVFRAREQLPDSLLVGAGLESD